MTEQAWMIPNRMTPNRAVSFDKDICIGCNRCVDICRSDVLMPNPESGKNPIVLYPDECWYCGTCVLECPRPGAITMLHPMNQAVSVVWKRRETGERFRLGMKDPPPPNRRPPAR
jgi:NAD-dependent dihydropyrimidine dehydrogenase PreA subunit